MYVRSPCDISHLFLLSLHAVNSQSPDYQRPRSWTTPGVHFGSSGLASDDNGDSESNTKRAKVRKRSYSAMLPHNVSVDQVKELTANLSITKQTGLIPEEHATTNMTTAPTKTNTANNHTHKNQTQNKTTRNSTSQLNTKGAQKYSNLDYDLHTTDKSAGKIQILPPVVRQGELGMKIEVNRLKTISDSSTLEQTSNITPTVDDRQQTGMIPNQSLTPNSRAIKRLSKFQEKEKKQAAGKSSHTLSQSPEMNEKPNNNKK